MSAPATVRVLLIEDDTEDARFILDLLGEAKRAAFMVDVAGTAAQAMDRIKKNRYDVLLLDYRLPDKSGLELMAEVKSLHFRIPVVFITSSGDQKLQDDALEAGVAEFLEKGTFTSDLLERTCLYAIGLHDRQIRNGSDAVGVGVLVQELVGLTRESITAQTKTTQQISELRTDLKDEVRELRAEIKEDVGRLEGHVSTLKDHADKQKADIIDELTKGPWGRIKDALGWIVEHPIATMMIFLGFISMIVLLVLLLQVLDPATIKAIRDAFGMIEVLENVPQLLG